MIVVINPYTVTELRINANRGEQMNYSLPAYGCGDQSSVKGERHLRVHLENSFTQFFLIVIIYSGTYSIWIYAFILSPGSEFILVCMACGSETGSMRLKLMYITIKSLKHLYTFWKYFLRFFSYRF